MVSTATKLSSAASVGNELERRRLEQRATRLGLVVAVLRERASASSRSSPIPRGLQHAITDFQAELSQVRARLYGERRGGWPLRGRSAREAHTGETDLTSRAATGHR